MKRSDKTWTATRYKHLYRHKSGIYYARLRIAGKQTWRTLGTEILSVAQHELTAILQEEKRRSEIDGSGTSAWASVGEMMKARETQIENDASTKSSTKKYWQEIHLALRRSWPELESLEIAKVSPTQCEAWAGRYVKNVSPSRYNNTIAAVKKLFALAVDRGVRQTNPAGQLKRVTPRQKDLTTKLPDRETFKIWVATIRKSASRWGDDCGDLVEFLAYTGLRIGEARCVTWADILTEKGEMVVKGDPEEGTKNRQIRRVPIIEDLSNLLERIKARRGPETTQTPILKVSHAREAMDTAAEKIDMPRITHHDLRHLFATTCIESGVDIPTVSKWLGHKDGGALAMKVYGHLRNEHSLAAARLVSFSS